MDKSGQSTNEFFKNLKVPTVYLVKFERILIPYFKEHTK